MDPIVFAKMQADFGGLLDMLEGLVQQAVSRGYTDDQARAMVARLVAMPPTENPI